MTFKYAILIPGCMLVTALGMAVAAEPASADSPAAMHGMAMPATAPSGPAVNTSNVAIHNFAFSPAAITVAPGTTVTWGNQDNAPHNVVMFDQSFRSTPMDTGDHFSHTFAAPGQYRYFCGLHPQMTGLVIVRNANG